jgi:hypothetical protein
MMTEVTLTILSPGARRELKMEGDRLFIGRAGGGARPDVVGVADDGLDPLHASVNRDGARVWVLDECSSGGTFVNGRRVPPQGLPLADGDKIRVGDQTAVLIRLRPLGAAGEPAPRERESRPRAKSDPSISPAALAAGLSLLLLCLLTVIAVARYNADGPDNRRAAPTPAAEEFRPTPPAAGPSPDQAAGGAPQQQPTTQPTPADNQNRPDPDADAEAEHLPGGATTYLQMSREARLKFLEGRARHISTMMGNRPYEFNEEVLGYIKQYVDGYALRVGNNVRSGWGADLRFVFLRARTQYTPHIIRAFRARGVPPVVGLYLVMIETEYNNIPGENSARAAGLFQFIPGTAILYGISPSERTNVEKMAPAAAHYMSDRIAEFGPDSMSVALAIAGYNRSPDSVRRDLRDVLAQEGSRKERSFWTLVANSRKLDHWFQGENIKYVPKFFAAAIIGETPRAFGLQMSKLSTYDSFQDSAAEQPEPTPEASPSPETGRTAAARGQKVSR